MTFTFCRSCWAIILFVVVVVISYVDVVSLGFFFLSFFFLYYIGIMSMTKEKIGMLT